MSKHCAMRYVLVMEDTVLWERGRVHVSVLSRVQLFVTPWTVACQAPVSMEFSRQEYWSGLVFPSPGNLPNLGIEPVCPALQVGSLLLSNRDGPEFMYTALRNALV